MAADAFPETFAALRALFDPYRDALTTAADDDGPLSLDAPPSAAHPKGLFFGAVRVGKRSVGFRLMPVDVHPSLLDGMSDALRKRMQGKSCFGFTRVEPALFAELERLTAAGFARYRETGVA